MRPIDLICQTSTTTSNIDQKLQPQTLTENSKLKLKMETWNFKLRFEISESENSQFENSKFENSNLKIRN